MSEHCSDDIDICSFQGPRVGIHPSTGSVGVCYLCCCLGVGGDGHWLVSPESLRNGPSEFEDSVSSDAIQHILRTEFARRELQTFSFASRTLEYHLVVLVGLVWMRTRPENAQLFPQRS